MTPPPANPDPSKHDLPTSIDEAAERVLQWPEISTLDSTNIFLSPNEQDLILHVYPLGTTIRDAFDIDRGNDALFRSAGVDSPMEVCLAILRAVRQRLFAMASAEQIEAATAASQRRRQEMDAAKRASDAKSVAHSATITDRRCTSCGAACPRYRKTCRACGFEMGRVQD